MSNPTAEQQQIKQEVIQAMDPILRRVVALETQVTTLQRELASLQTKYKHQVEVIRSRINYGPEQ